MSEGENIIIEVDPGLDDAYGLAILVGAQRMGIVNILAIVCSVGNIPRDQACKNLIQILHVLNFTAVQVYEGSEYPINRPPKYLTSWGPRGMGNLPKASNCESDIIICTMSEFGYFLEGEMKKYKGAITLIVMAPLTTTATLMLLNSKLNFKQIWVMGGNAIGSYVAEPKFHWDPEATFSVFKYTPVPLTLVTADLTRSVKISRRWREHKLGKISSPFVHMMNEAETLDIRNTNDVDVWYMDDAVLAVAFVFPEIVQSAKRYEVIINIEEYSNSSGLDCWCTSLEMKRLILDCDVGTDDALALFILLRAEQKKLVKIEAICCSMGNTTVENVCKNVIRLLEITRRTDIPVYKGSPEELIRSTKLMTTYHGIDGFGDIPFENPPDLNLIQKDPSSLAMYNIAQKHKNDVYLIALGPLTNVALAMKINPDFTDYLKGIYIMGGNYKAIGNVTKTAEFNFHVDPEAVHIVLNEAKCPITILPWETCEKPKISCDWRWNVFGKLDNKAIRLLTKAEEKVYADKNRPYWRSCDSFLTAAFVRPDYVRSSKTFHATIELHGYETRGQLVLDHTKNEKDNMTIITGIDREEYKKILLDLSAL